MPVAMLGQAIAVGLLTLGAGLVAVLLLRLLPSLRLQLAGLAALSVCLPLASVLLSGWVAFKMGDDVKILAVSAASATVAVVAGLVLAHSIAGSVDRVRDASARLARGDLSVRAPESGPAEVAELAASFNEMATGLEQLFDARRELVAWASHDLRTPLANMQAMLEALEDGLAEPDEYLAALRDQVRALGLLVDDLFELARIDAGILTLELRDAELAGLVRSCLTGLAAEANARHVRLETDVHEGLTVRCAPEKVERVLFNLLTNALRHTPSDGSVAVRVAREPAEVRVSVEDTGAGLEREPERRRGGAGLGLAIARGLVEAHGGRIWTEDRAEGGARVSFTLPAP
jgi:signal transduction histidine kinase